MTSGAKMRVYEIAKELNLPNKELIAKIRALGLEVNNHMSSLDADDVNRLKRSIERERLEQTETKRLSSTVLRRRSKGDGEGEAPSPGPVIRRRAAVPAESSESAPAAPPSVSRPAVVARSSAPAAPSGQSGNDQPQVRPVVRAREAAPTPQPVSRPSTPASSGPASSGVRPQPAAVAEERPVAPVAQPAAPETEAKAREAAPVPSKPIAPETVKETVKETAKSVTKEAIQEPTTDTATVSRREAQADGRTEPAKTSAPSPAASPLTAPVASPVATADQPSARPQTETKAPEKPAAPVAQPRPEPTKAVAQPVEQAAAPAARAPKTPESPAPARAEAESRGPERRSERQSDKQPEPTRSSGAPQQRAQQAPAPQESPRQQPKAAPKAPVVIQGPAVVTIGGPAPARGDQGDQGQRGGGRDREQQGRGGQDKRRPMKHEGVVKRSAKKGPTTVQEVAQTARSRFEEELARARERVSAREAEEQRRREDETAKLETQKGRDPNRPAVGTVIALPIPRIKILERTPTAPRPGQTPAGGPGQIRGRFANQQQKTRPGGGPGGGATRGAPGAKTARGEFGKRRPPLIKGKGLRTQITTPAEHKRVIRMEEMISVPELAKAMGVKANEVLKKLWGMGMVGLNINASIDFETAQILSSEFGYEVQNVAFKEAEVFVSQPDEEKDLVWRAPVVTVMGHVDHGKTSLLDYIRKSRVAAGEAGGITQHIAAYKVSAGNELGDVVFLDTPGHEAFTEMRARGAQATDIVVLVVAANDGVMPQTLEALSHAKDAKVTIIVAVNKCDLPDAQPERVRQQLAEHGLIPEEWGGDTQYMNVSAIRGDGIPELLEVLALQAELLELKANPNKPALGVVIEAKLDRNRGPMATVLIQEGQLKVGDTVVAGCFYGKVRAMLDATGKALKVAGPSTPVELLGLDGVPDAGETLNVADDEKVAKQVVEHRRQARRKRELATTGRISLENLMERIQEGESHELKVVLKADVQGSSEALKAALVKLSTDKVRVNVISAGVGGITESDVNLAKAGGAIIVGFHVRPAGKSAKHAEKEGVQIKLYDVIYDAMEDVRGAMAGLLAPIKRENEIGKLEVRDTFTIPKIGTVAGCMVTEGKILRKSLLRVIRDAVQVYEGKVGSLRRFKEDTSEVKQGFECGLMVQGFNDIRVGDIVEAYEIIEEAAKL